MAGRRAGTGRGGHDDGKNVRSKSETGDREGEAVGSSAATPSQEVKMGSDVSDRHADGIMAADPYYFSRTNHIYSVVCIY